jgi:plasmid replication initiation protein
MRKVKEKKNSKMAAHNKNNPREATAAAVEEAMLAEEAEEDVPAS